MKILIKIKNVEILLIDNDMQSINTMKLMWKNHENIVNVHQITDAIKLFMDKNFNIVISDSSLFTNNLSAIDCYKIYRKLYRRSPYILLFSKDHEVKSLFSKYTWLSQDPYLEYMIKPFNLRDLNTRAEWIMSETFIFREKQDVTLNSSTSDFLPI